MTLALDYAARSDRGLVRGNNEDSAVAASHLLALADGMGGHAAGEVASQLMIEALFPLNALFTGDPVPAERLPGMLVEAMDAGNRAIAAHVDENPTLEGMGCTLSSLLFNDGKLGVCHVGDSRGYLLRDGVLTQITKDDTYVQSLVDEGKLDPADVSSHPQRSLILKALTGRPVEPTLQLRDALPGDRYMLCSDGLSDPVSADTIRDVLAEGTPDAAASKLIDLALRGGGPDNVTVVVADVVDTDAGGDADGAGTAAVLPTEVALAGAIDSEATELPRPDTAAGRAMSVNVVNRSSTPAPAAADPGASRRDNAVPGMRRSRRVGAAGTADGDAADADPDRARRGRRRRRRMIVALAVLVVLVAVVGVGGWIAKRDLNDSYYVAVAADADLPTPSAAPSTLTVPEGTPSGAPGAPTSGVPDADASAAPGAGPTDPAAPAAPADRTAASSAAAATTARAASPSPTVDASASSAAKGTPIIIYQGAPGSVLGLSLHSAYQEICLDRDASVQLLPAGSTDPCHRFSTADLTPAARGTLDTLPRDSYPSVQDQLRRLAEQTLPICVTRSSDNADNADGDPADLTTPGVSCREVN